MHLSFEELVRIDERLAALGRGEGALRLRIGEAAAEIERMGFFHALGFSNFGDYATQRCTFGKGWLNESRRVAKRLASLPLLRRALVKGELAWCMAEVCSRTATPHNEAKVLERAKQSTVRQMEAWLRELAADEKATNEAPASESGSSALASESASSSEPETVLEPVSGAVGEPERRPSADDDDWSAFPSARAANLTFLGRADEIFVPPNPVAPPKPYVRAIDPAWLPLDLSGQAAALDKAKELERLRLRTLSRMVPSEEAVAFEITKMVASHVTGSSRLDVMVDALLSEAESTLINLGVVDMLAVEAKLEKADEEWSQWLRQSAEAREQGEEACEPNIAPPVPAVRHESLERPLPTTAADLDDELVGLCFELAGRDLEIGMLAERLFRSEAWPSLKYASVRQYARERMGVSQSTLEHKRMLARRSGELPGLREAVAKGRIGYAVALMIGRIATPDTVAAWIERAERRTVKHLCEEIQAAEMLARNGAIAQIRPPTDEELAAVFALEEALLNGELLPRSSKARNDEVSGGGASPAAQQPVQPCDGGAGIVAAPQKSDEGSEGSALPALQCCDAGASRASSEMVAIGSDVLDEAPAPFNDRVGTLVATSGAALIGMVRDAADRVQGLPKVVEEVFRHRGMVRLRLRLPDHLVLRWRALEASHRRIRGKHESFLMFLCMVAWREWAPDIDVEVKFKHIHARDRFRCLCPVCTKRNIGPHHLQRRSKNGNDTKENNVSACYVCHLPGIHQQCWLKVERTPNGVRWIIGRDPTLIVEGRELVHERRSSLQGAAA